MKVEIGREKLKRALVFLLVGPLLLLNSTSVMAAETQNVTAPGNASVQISFTRAPDYTVQIPLSVSLSYTKDPYCVAYSNPERAGGGTGAYMIPGDSYYGSFDIKAKGILGGGQSVVVGSQNNSVLFTSSGGQTVSGNVGYSTSYGPSKELCFTNDSSVTNGSVYNIGEEYGEYANPRVFVSVPASAVTRAETYTGNMVFTIEYENKIYQ